MIKLAVAFFLAALTACAPRPEFAVPEGMEKVEITATVPANTGEVYVSGSVDALGPWKADALLMQGSGTERRAEFLRPEGVPVEYKFTLGAWEREGLGPSGTVMANFVLPADQTSGHQTVVDFKKDVREYIADVAGAGIAGHLDYWLDVKSQYLTESRHVSIWTPPGYDDDPARTYRVIYMTDGQNLFDPRIANTGTDWGTDEAMTALMANGIDPAIIVSSWSTPKRFEEYSPWHKGESYARFLIDELMPRVEAAYRVRKGPGNTFHAGSSMGGLISFYVVTYHPDVFGACGCVSTHFPLSEKVVAEVFPNMEVSATPDATPYILNDIARGLKPPPNTRYWFDHGTKGLDAEYGPTHEAIRNWLLVNGLAEGRDFSIRAYEGADHNEASWRARLPEVFTFLLSPDPGSSPE